MLSSAKMYGGIGSLLPFIGAILIAVVFLIHPSIKYASLIGVVISIIGLILIIIAVKIISEEAKDQSIFSNYIVYAILAIINTIVGMIKNVGMGFAFTGNFKQMMGGNIATHPSFSWGKITAILIIFVITWILGMIGAIFLKKSFDSIASKTKVRLFSTAALIYLIGAILMIVFGIGGILVFIFAILQIIAFFSLPEKIPA